MMTVNPTHSRRALSAALALAAIAAAPAQAVAAVTPTVTPIGSRALVLTSAPGRTALGDVAVSNPGGRAMLVRLEAADLVSGAAGGPDFQTRNPSRAGRWLAIPARVRVPAHRVVRVPFRLSIPSGAAGGAHYAGIVATDAGAATPVKKPASRRPARRTVTISRVVRSAVPVTVNLPGPRIPALQLTGVKLAIAPTGGTLELRLLQTGSVLIRQTDVDLAVQRDGRTLFTHRAQLAELLPDARGIAYTVPWKGRPVQGSYQIVGTLRPQGAPVIHVNRTVDFTPATAKRLEEQTGQVALPAHAVPVWLVASLLLAALVIAALVLGVWRLRRRLAAAPAG
jgi:hypothetical protein